MAKKQSKNNETVALPPVDHLEARKVAAKAAIGVLIDEVNGGSPDKLAEWMVERLQFSHRTLQQSFLGAVKLALFKYSRLDPGNWTDLRNEAAWKWAKAVSEIPNSDVRFPLY